MDLGALPPELLHSCFAWLDADDLLRAAQVSQAFERECGADDLWASHYDRRWPPWTLLVPEHSTHALPRRQVYRLRSLHRLPLALSPAVLTLHGSTTDAYDGNTTPLEVAMCVAPPGRLSSALQIAGKLLAQASFGAGSKHNDPGVKVWLGSAAPQEEQPGEDRAASPPISIELSEHSSTFGVWRYRGTVTSDGREVRGVFHLSILPRKRGQFVLRACDPATHVGTAAGGLPSRNQLVKRVAVKWASSALNRMTAIHELAEM